MTIHARNLFIIILTIIALMTTTALSLFLVLRQEVAVESLWQLNYWVWTHRAHAQSTLINYYSVLFLQIYSAVMLLIIYRFFRKSHTTEIFCLVIFLAGWILQSFRVFIPYTGTVISLDEGVFFTRIAYLGRYMGLMALLYAALYFGGMQNQFSGTTIFTLSLMIFGLCSKMPVDSTLIFSNNLIALADAQTAFITYLVLSVLTLVSYFLIMVTKGFNGSNMMILATLFLIVGGDLVFFATNWIDLILAPLMLIGGTILFVAQIRTRYLWSSFRR